MPNSFAKLQMKIAAEYSMGMRECSLKETTVLSMCSGKDFISDSMS